MPNRILREGIVGSQRISLLSQGAQLFYYKLISVVDDYGRYEAYPEMLRARCYPFELDRVTVADVSTWLCECGQMPANDRQSPLVTEYCVEGKKYLQINNFGQRERAERFPSPSLADKSEQLRTKAARASNTNTLTNTNSTTGEEVQEKGEPVSPMLTPEPPAANGHVTALAVIAQPIGPDPLEVLEELEPIYAARGVPVPGKHHQLILQYLLDLTVDQRNRVVNYVKWAFYSGKWSNPSKTKGLMNLLAGPGDWDIEITPEMLRKSREPPKHEQKAERMEEARKRMEDAWQ